MVTCDSSTRKHGLTQRSYQIQISSMRTHRWLFSPKSTRACFSTVQSQHSEPWVQVRRRVSHLPCESESIYAFESIQQFLLRRDQPHDARMPTRSQ